LVEGVDHGWMLQLLMTIFGQQNFGSDGALRDTAKGGNTFKWGKMYIPFLGGGDRHSCLFIEMVH
jgi:hypothetical protein